MGENTRLLGPYVGDWHRADRSDFAPGKLGIPGVFINLKPSVKAANSTRKSRARYIHSGFGFITFREAVPLELLHTLISVCMGRSLSKYEFEVEGVADLL